MFATRFIRALFCLLLAALAGERLALAQGQDRRHDMVDSFIDYRHGSRSLYQPPPITHLVPNFNTLTYALAFEKRDITVFSKDEDGDRDPSGYDKLSQTGYTIAPHLAMSLKKVGLGFSIENSKNQAFYDFRQSNGSNVWTQQQKSVVAASGLGLNLSSLPFESLRKDNKLAVIIGGKSLAVKHQMSDFQTVLDNEVNSYRYSVLKLEAGANFTLKLLNHFSVIPWIDYTHTSLGDAETAFKASSEYAADTQREIYEDDLRLFWRNHADFRYGIDLAIRMMNFEVRIGSLFGAVARLNATPDIIVDSTFTVSLSFDQKGG